MRPLFFGPLLLCFAVFHALFRYAPISILPGMEWQILEGCPMTKATEKWGKERTREKWTEKLGAAEVREHQSRKAERQEQWLGTSQQSQAAQSQLRESSKPQAAEQSPRKSSCREATGHRHAEGKSNLKCVPNRRDQLQITRTSVLSGQALFFGQCLQK